MIVAFRKFLSLQNSWLILTEYLHLEKGNYCKKSEGELYHIQCLWDNSVPWYKI